MKSTIALFFLVIGTHIYAQSNLNVNSYQEKYNPEEIYKSINVKEVSLNSESEGVSKKFKSIGGLTCFSEFTVLSNFIPMYSCIINHSIVQFSLIYKALIVKEVRLDLQNEGSVTFGKNVGGLSCTRQNAVVPNSKPIFSCQISD